MKLKYFLRGMGSGILVVILVIILVGAEKLSDEEIKKRAKAMGMMTAEEVENEYINRLRQAIHENTADENDNKTVDQNQTSDQNLNPSGQQEQNLEDNSNSQKDTEKEDSDSEQKQDIETGDNSDDSKISEEEKKITITVESGMSAKSVSNMLEEKGLIKDASEFNQYLKENEYQTKVLVGTYTIAKDATFEEITDAICRKEKKKE